VCEHRRISVGRSFDHRGLVPHLRCWASGEAVYPALPGWATVFRAPGAPFRITYQQLQITNSQRRVSHPEARATPRSSPFSRAHAQIKNQPCQCADPQWTVPTRASQGGRANAPVLNRARQGQSAGGATHLTLRRLRHGGTVCGTRPLVILRSARAEAKNPSGFKTKAEQRCFGRRGGLRMTVFRIFQPPV
jgi:hypothetical protein